MALKTKDLNIALISLGYWGKICVKTLSTLSNIKLKYIVTSQSQPKDILPTIELLPSWKHLLDKQDIDGVIIASPSATHYEIAKAFIQKNIPVFIEKPMTLCVKQAEELYQLEKKFSCPVVVDHILLFSPAFRVISDYIKTSNLNIHEISFTAGKYKPYPHDVSMLWEWAPHDLAMCFNLINGPLEIKDITQQKKQIDTNYCQEINLTAQVKSAKIKFKWSTLLETPTRKMIIQCSDRRIEFNDKTEHKVTIIHANNEVEHLNYSSKLALTAAFEHFSECIKKQTPSFTNTTLGLNVVSTISQINTYLLPHE